MSKEGRRIDEKRSPDDEFEEDRQYHSSSRYRSRDPERGHGESSHHRHKHKHRHHHTHRRRKSGCSDHQEDDLNIEKPKETFVYKEEGHKIGQLRPEDIPEDLDFSDPEPEGAFPLSKDRPLPPTDIILPRIESRDYGSIGGGESQERPEESGNQLERDGKIVIELKSRASKIIKSRRSRQAESVVGSSGDYRESSMGSWQVTAVRRQRSRSRSRSRERDRRRRRSRSRSRERDKRRQVSERKEESSTSLKKSLEYYLDKCRYLAEEETRAAQSLASEYYNPSMVYQSYAHPYDVKDQPLVVPNMADVLSQIRHRVAMQQMDPASLMDLFPVSCGVEHRKEEDTVTSTSTVPDGVDSSIVNKLISKRFLAERKLNFDPYDYIARQTIQEVGKEVQYVLCLHCYIMTFLIVQLSKLTAVKSKEEEVPNQTKLSVGNETDQKPRMLTPQELASGRQAWAKKDQFSSLRPVKSDVGLKILHKMGWKDGQALGKTGTGNINPLEMPVKFDRKGLSSEDEVSRKKRPLATSQLHMEGRHPVSVLMEIATQLQWVPPCFELVKCDGPPHARQFLFKVTVNGSQFEAKAPACTKKEAKAKAALAALQGLGIDVGGKSGQQADGPSITAQKILLH
eukprot:m.81648 g.81648  ORF g.81648 m.81648 type:complete len:627 (+) comp36241_c0_seq2:202-2082(+)